jgi:CDP-diacylglycerol--glycerol-3-phosphate 3-phosphatidyltransferase
VGRCVIGTGFFALAVGGPLFSGFHLTAGLAYIRPCAVYFLSKGIVAKRYSQNCARNYRVPNYSEEILNIKRVFYRNIPNGLSLLRILLVLPFIIIIHDIFVFKCTKNLFLLITFFIIIISDIADGFLARKLKCTSDAGSKLDIVSDTLYTILSLAIFAHFKIIPVWFIFLMVLKLIEFIITSKIIKNKQRTDSIIFFDRIGKISISIAMLLPGIFVFRCIIIDYKTVMNIIVYIITVMLIISFFNRIIEAVKYKRMSLF